MIRNTYLKILLLTTIFLYSCHKNNKVVKEFDITIFANKEFVNNNLKIPHEILSLLRIYETDLDKVAYIPNIKVVRRDISENNMCEIIVPLASGNALRKWATTYGYDDCKNDYSIDNIDKTESPKLLFQKGNGKPLNIKLEDFDKHFYFSENTICKFDQEITNLDDLIQLIQNLDKEKTNKISIILNDKISDTLKVIEVTNNNNFQNVIDGNNTKLISFKCNRSVSNLSWSVSKSDNVKLNIKSGNNDLGSQRLDLIDHNKVGSVVFIIKPQNECYYSEPYEYTVHVLKKQPISSDYRILSRPILQISGLTCSWERVLNADHYLIEIGQGNELHRINEIRNLEYDLRNAFFYDTLRCNTDYSVSLTAICPQNQQRSNVKTLNIKCNCDNIDVNVIFAQKSDKTFLFTCSPVRNNYRYFVEFNGKSHSISSNLFGGENDYEIIKNLWENDRSTVINMKFGIDCSGKKYFSKSFVIKLGCWLFEGRTKCGITSVNNL